MRRCLVVGVQPQERGRERGQVERGVVVVL